MGNVLESNPAKFECNEPSFKSQSLTSHVTIQNGY
jgi:hypothetical protein